MVQDASALLDPQVMAGAEELARRNITSELGSDVARMYHPDGTTSLILLPPLARNGKNLNDRRMRVMHYVMNKRGPKGEQWWFATPPEGWQPQPLPYRCPVDGCTRAGGLPNLRQVWMHIRHKHPEESVLYQGVLKAIEAKLQGEVEPNLMAALGVDMPKTEATEQAPTPIYDIPARPSESPSATTGKTLNCRECGYETRATAKSAKAALNMHIRVKHGRLSDAANRSG